MPLSAKGAILYRSRYGATRQYAEWLAGKLKWPLLNAENTTGKDLSGYNTLIIGSSVYIGKLLLKDWLKKNGPDLANKTLLFFVVCGTPSDQKEECNIIARTNFPHDLIGPDNIFFLPGRLSFRDLSLKDKIMLKIGARLQKDPTKKRSMLEDSDNVKKEHIYPILQQVAIPIETH